MESCCKARDEHHCHAQVTLCWDADLACWFLYLHEELVAPAAYCPWCGAELAEHAKKGEPPC